MKKSLLLLSIGVLALAACSESSTTSTTAASAAPANEIAENACLTAALTYADWCSSCKIIDPLLAEAKTSLRNQAISYVTLDYTAKNADAMFAAADAAGVGTAIRTALADEVKTGLLLLVDTTKNEVVGTVNKSFSAEQMVVSLSNAAKSCGKDDAEGDTMAPKDSMAPKEESKGYGS